MPETTRDAVVKIGGKEVDPPEVHDILVAADLDQPDMAAVTLSNQSTSWSEMLNEGDDVMIKFGTTTGRKAGTIFKGEVTGIEPMFVTKGEARVIVRALNELHGLSRGKQSRPWGDGKKDSTSDRKIVDEICRKHHLTPN